MMEYRVLKDASDKTISSENFVEETRMNIGIVY